MKDSLLLTPKVFKLLHDKCIEKVDDFKTKREIYGFDKEGAKKDGTLKDKLEKHDGVKKLFKEKQGGLQVINTKYFYQKYTELKKEINMIKLEGYHCWLYLTFLGYSDINKFLIKALEEGKLSEADVKKQQQYHNPENSKKVIFGCYHYSKLWHGIYIVQIEVNFDSPITVRKGRPIYDVIAISAVHPYDLRPIKSEGEAFYEGRNFIIDIKAVGEGGGSKKIIIPMETVHTMNDISGNNRVFVGSYLGVSRNADIISGKVCLKTIKEGEEISKIPLEISRYLNLEKHQVRTDLEPIGYELSNLPSKRDSEDILDRLVGKFRFCWLTPKKRLVESELIISREFELEIRTFMSKLGIYTGDFFVQNHHLCISSIRLRSNSKGVSLTAAVYLNISHLARKIEEKYIKGSYMLTGPSPDPVYGSCILERIDDNIQIQPEVYHIDEAPESLGEIKRQLLKMRKKWIDKAGFDKNKADE